ncbi:ABC transporter permease [Thermodesulforhabdus norvegica]|uniref:ABC-2 type transport system permease protein n=1 Tax=Thermodesulforhabdus norvegica TaxID=39841 RepID=A0A1I4R9D8_9BACT|nr:ABC-2 family transporter protein [Thermodesulforhabdus norvegica]SFM48829.1 ABC-2 type transport system permease protein [Thermodesulforhabdus norvegica]
MKTPRLLVAFLKNSLLVDMEYRTHFVVNSFMSLFWICFSLLSLSLFFHHRQEIGGWSYHEAMLVMGFFSFFGSFIEGILEPNVAKLVEDIRFGNFDFILVKPVNVQIIGTLRVFSIKKFPGLVAGLGVCIYALCSLKYTPSVEEVISFVILFICAFVILYNLWVMLVSTAFWFIQIDSIMEFIFSLFETGRFPVSVYPAPIRIFLTFIVPIAFITTFPSGAILGKIGYSHVVAGLFLALGTTFLSIRLWKYALRQYSSASS